jgi:hypothetical protein
LTTIRLQVKCSLLGVADISLRLKQVSNCSSMIVEVGSSPRTALRVTVVVGACASSYSVASPYMP